MRAMNFFCGECGRPAAGNTKPNGAFECHPDAWAYAAPHGGDEEYDEQRAEEIAVDFDDEYEAGFR